VSTKIPIDLSSGARGGADEPAWFTPAVYAVLFILCLVTYHGISDNYLFNDDFSWISRARYEMTPSNMFTYRVVAFFRPLVNVTFYVFERLAPGNLKLYYSTNLLLHFLCSVLVFHIFLRILRDRWQAAAGAFLFAVSSIHTGAVFWISARTTLLSSALLLGATLLLMPPKAGSRRTVIASSTLFALALLAKETAIAGLPILLVIWLLYRKESGAGSLKTALISWTVVSVMYLAARGAVIGGFTQHNWGPGLHMLRNTAGGFLYQLRPWPFFSLFWHEGTALKEPAHPLLPELTVIGAIAFIWWLGRAAGKGREFMLATAWTLVALVPASAFRYRFYSTVSITQNRYYYLSSVGAILLFVLVLALLWNSRRTVLRVICAVVLAVFIAGSIVRVDRLEKVWSDFTRMYEESVAFIVTTVEDEQGISAVAIEDPPLAFPYAAEAVSLYHPEWTVREVEGGPERARGLAPCVYIGFKYEGDRVAGVDIQRLDE
jgi:hypothetical protein